MGVRDPGEGWRRTLVAVAGKWREGHSTTGERVVERFAGDGIVHRGREHRRRRALARRDRARDPATPNVLRNGGSRRERAGRVRDRVCAAGRGERVIPRVNVVASPVWMTG